MEKHKYAGYYPKHFDKYNCLKLPLSLYLLLAFILRGYLVWLMSVTNMRDHVSFLQWVFPQQQGFYISLLSGSIGIFIVFLIAMRRPDAADWVKTCWQHGRKLILLALYFDLSVNVFAFMHLNWSSAHILGVQCAVVFICTAILYTSKRINIVFEEFPESFSD